ncbi:putative primosomal DNA helicase dnai [Mycoplasmopsis columbina SF7]|uniref:Putative primosomal DNA helicase dnai n=1 Tax=Mycoplasmopsis columbina SF7 TaxID=1037410 RepID=F9UKR3_9BACT|nr:DnaA/Hda family protein [Mycoplasmopsis columbina]EGV00268.1 putative primosomal DNA helicase dnai [Mycoplasmopsis columbina SF7]
MNKHNKTNVPMNKSYQSFSEILNFDENDLKKATLKYLKKYKVIQEAIKINSITDEELFTNSFLFLEIIEDGKRKNSPLYEFFVGRKNTGELIIKKELSSKNTYIKNLNLWLTEISEPKQNLDFKKISFVENRHVKEELVNKIAELIKNPNFKNFKGFFLHSKKATGKSFFLQACANELANEKISVAYILTDELQKFVYSSFDKNKGINELKHLLATVSVLILDNFSLIKISEYFVNDFLWDIISQRLRDNRLIFFASSHSIDETENIFIANIEKSKHLTTKMFELIRNNTIEYEY